MITRKKMWHSENWRLYECKNKFRITLDIKACVANISTFVKKISTLSTSITVFNPEIFLLLIFFFGDILWNFLLSTKISKMWNIGAKYLTWRRWRRWKNQKRRRIRKSWSRVWGRESWTWNHWRRWKQARAERKECREEAIGFMIFIWLIIVYL